MERTAIHDAVEKARVGDHPYLIAKLDSGFVVASDIPLVRGHCVLLSDPVVFSLNDLSEEKRALYQRDYARVGDALIKVLGSYRINYETMCNVAQALHTHIVPRFLDEADAKRKERPAIAYTSNELTRFVPAENQEFISRMRIELLRLSV